MNYPKVVSIVDTKIENKNVKTIFFNCSSSARPGQFFMIWIPGIDEIPMSVSYINNDIKGITFKRVGDATSALFKLKKGDKIGIRGPYGNYFKINGKNIIFVGGGTGIAAIAPAVEEAINKKINCKVIIGAKSKEELFFEKRLKDTGAELYIATDDGSKGFKGYASDLAIELINRNKFDQILTCGPELMMKKIFNNRRDTPFQASLERYMKCGIGLCGQCCIGEGLRVCKEGPVFDDNVLKSVEDFGIYKRDASGKKIIL